MSHVDSNLFHREWGKTVASPPLWKSAVHAKYQLLHGEYGPAKRDSLNAEADT